MSKRIIISGGGTGGHIYPALAVADAIKASAPQTEILFVGASGKMEMEKVPAVGYAIKGLWIDGLQRRFTLKNLLLPFKIVYSLFQANQIIRSFKPDCVIGFGGYASAAIGKVAAWRGIPLYLQEQNAFPGITNKLLAKNAKTIFVAFEGLGKYFSASKIAITGNPTRSVLTEKHIEESRAKAAQKYETQEAKYTIFLFGGSLGARLLNNLMVDAHQWLQEHPQIHIIWQCGSLYFQEMKQSKTADLQHVTLREFVYDMDMAYAAADLVICRAGAITLAELVQIAMPSLLVPSSNVAEDHQTKNAKAMVKQGAAEMMTEADARNDLFQSAYALVQDTERVAEMKSNLRRIRVEGAADTIANVILNSKLRAA